MSYRLDDRAKNYKLFTKITLKVEKATVAAPSCSEFLAEYISIKTQ